MLIPIPFSASPWATRTSAVADEPASPRKPGLREGVAVLSCITRQGDLPGRQVARGPLPATVLHPDSSGRAQWENRRRRLHAWSLTTRRRVKPCGVVTEGTDYALLPAECAERQDDIAQTILKILGETPSLTSAEIYANWPTEKSVPRLRTLQSRLLALESLGWINHTGEGSRRSRYRYEVAGEVCDDQATEEPEAPSQT